MASDHARLRMDATTLNKVSDLMNEYMETVGKVRDAIDQLTLPLWPDDPLLTHERLVSAFERFRKAWGEETGFTADAAGDIKVGLWITAYELEEVDRAARRRAEELKSKTARPPGSR